MLGGDCLVDLAPFAYLNERYDGALAMLWIDAQGSMSIDQIVRLTQDVARVADVVGLGIAEHLPWDALAMKSMLERLALIGDTRGETS
ncbi:hypothetical protein B7R78_0017875 [Ralstonia solanacearum]|uniref:hypothetical protein n=1 Tax=Ralstonia solanacearum species complex TaxID=3116862 RepID=UPI0018D1293B|nr:hypothetical protein [Ralstonia solanacearum]MBT1538899.1 hypothetical protein [Ralstonia solanacearum]